MDSPRALLMGHPRPRGSLARRGSVFVFVLSAATLAAAAGIAGILLHTERLRRVELAVQAQKATVDAQSALEYAVAVVNQDPAGTTWRASATLAFSDKRYFGNDASLVSIALTDPGDNDLADSNLDPVKLSVNTVMSPCEQTYEVTMTPMQSPLSCLDYAVVVGGALTKSGTGNIYTRAPVSTAKSWPIDSDPRPSVIDELTTAALPTPAAPAPVTVWRPPTVGVVSAAAAMAAGGIQRTGVPWNPATMEAMIPNSTDIFKYYLSIGTAIDYNALPGGSLTKVVLSPARNPYGVTNASGVYVIDCLGNKIEVRDCRIQGTLVLVNIKSDSKVRDSVCIEPVSDAFPSLLVDGSMSLETDGTDLDEADIKVSLNPSGSPYEGVADADQVDKYPNWIKGVAYFTGDITLSKIVTIKGVMVVGGSLDLSDKAELRVLHTKPTQIIPGFARIGGMGMVPGSLQRVVK